MEGDSSRQWQRRSGLPTWLGQAGKPDLQLYVATNITSNGACADEQAVRTCLYPSYVYIHVSRAIANWEARWPEFFGVVHPTYRHAVPCVERPRQTHRMAI